MRGERYWLADSYLPKFCVIFLWKQLVYSLKGKNSLDYDLINIVIVLISSLKLHSAPFEWIFQ